MTASSANRIETATDPSARPAPPGHTCPWWLGPLLASPLRRLFDNPEPMLRALIAPGMTVLDFGCAMGFHSLPAARLAGERGRVICLDVQPRMLAGLRRRARKAGLLDRIDARLCPPDGLGLGDDAGRIDVALAIHVLHETPDIPRTLAHLRAALRPGGKLLLAEPAGHVSAAAFAATLAQAEAAGFRPAGEASLRRSRAVVLARDGAGA